MGNEDHEYRQTHSEQRDLGHSCAAREREREYIVDKKKSCWYNVTTSKDILVKGPPTPAPLINCIH